MKFNKAEIAVLARQPSNNFDKEGVLFVRERSEGLFGKNKNEAKVNKMNVCLGVLGFYLTLSVPGRPHPG